MVKSQLPDVDISVIDGGLGSSTSDATGVHFKIGVCSGGEVGTIYTFTNPDKVTETLGTGPLVNSILESIQEGAQIVRAVKANSSVIGTKSSITKTGSGIGNVSISGDPLDSYDIVIEIVKAGGFNAAQLTYSLDGGDTWSDKATIPINGIISLIGTGLTLTFTQGSPAEQSFILSDRFTFKTKAPEMSNADFIAAMDTIKNSNYDYEFIHVVGESSLALWSLCSSEASTLEQNHIYTFFICEARNKDDTETIDTYVNALVADAANFTSTRVMVVAARCEASTLDGKQKDINGAGILCGILAKSKVCESPGKVKSYKATSALKLQPLGLNQGHILALDTARYVTFRQYQGVAGIYVTNGKMMAPSGSDYKYVEVRRTADKVSREVRLQAISLLQSEVSDLGAIEHCLQVPLDNMASNTVQEIVGYTLVIPKNQNIYSTETLFVEISIMPFSIMRWICISQKMNNPFLKE